jgi:hypothetical protein
VHGAFIYMYRHTTPFFTMRMCVNLESRPSRTAAAIGAKQIIHCAARRTTEKRLKSILIRRHFKARSVNFKRENFSFTIALAAIEKFAPGAAWEPSPYTRNLYESSLQISKKDVFI